MASFKDMAEVIRHEPNTKAALEAIIMASHQSNHTVMFLDQHIDKDMIDMIQDEPGLVLVDLSMLQKPATHGMSAAFDYIGQKAKDLKLQDTFAMNAVQFIGDKATEALSIAEDNSYAKNALQFFGRKKTPNLKEKLQKLQESVHKGLHVEIETFENWAKNQQASVLGAHPETKEDVTNLIKAAKTHGLKVRTHGERHSWSPIVIDDGQLLIHLDKVKSDYPKEANVRLAPNMTNQVDVMAWASTGDLKTFQIENKVNLPCNVLLDAVKLGGVIGTGSHGVGWDVNTPGDYVTQMRIFDSDGNLRTYTKEDPMLMRAVSANFGMFGIIYDMRIQLVPERIMKLKNVYTPARTYFTDPKEFKKLVESNWSVELFWFPYNKSLHGHPTKYDPLEDDLLIRVINDDTTGHEVEPPKFYKSQARSDLISSLGMKAGAHLYKLFPGMTPHLCLVAFNALRKLYPDDRAYYQQLPYAVHYRKYIHLCAVRDMEFVFDLNDDYQKVIEVINVVKDTMMKYHKEGKYPLNITLEMRWMAYGKSFMTPSTIGNPEYGGSGKSYYIEILSMNDTPHWQEFCNAIAAKWMEMGGLPHFAKEWDCIPGIFEHIKKKMARNIEQFKSQLKASNADPDDIFLNSTMSKLFDM